MTIENKKTNYDIWILIVSFVLVIICVAVEKSDAYSMYNNRYYETQDQALQTKALVRTLQKLSQEKPNASMDERFIETAQVWYKVLRMNDKPHRKPFILLTFSGHVLDMYLALKKKYGDRIELSPDLSRQLAMFISYHREFLRASSSYTFAESQLRTFMTSLLCAYSKEPENKPLMEIYFELIDIIDCVGGIQNIYKMNAQEIEDKVTKVFGDKYPTDVMKHIIKLMRRVVDEEGY
ncbi:MAG: hypothetical protein ACRCX2_26665 [Paraclostridium sp.]